MSINQISVFLENNPGTLNRMTHVLADGGINLRAISLAETKDFGIARIIVDNVYNATAVLKEAEFVSTLTPVLACEIPDEAGGLNKLLMLFTEAGVNIEYMYSCIVSQNGGKAYMIFRVSDIKSAERALIGKGITVLEENALS